ncbi:hypothetical protein V8E54_006321 [Elaphomyces granulatus]
METDPTTPTQADEHEAQDQKIKSWDETILLAWIQRNSSVPLKPDDTAKLNTRIDGEAFLGHARQREFF